MISRKIYLIFLSIFLLNINLYSSENDKTGDKDLIVFISMNKYYFEENEPVFLEVNIKNNTDKNVKICIYDELYTTFRPIVYDLSGREAETIVQYRLENKQIYDIIKSVNPRIIEISKNETITFNSDLRALYNLEKEKEFRVKVIFSPDVLNLPGIASQNNLNFRTIKTAYSMNKSGIERVKKYTSPERTVSPSEAVLLFLQAERDSDWDKYFKYIEINKFINAYPDYVKIYYNAVAKNDIDEKEKIIEQFANFLKKERGDYIIDFKIIDEIIKDGKAFVYAQVERFGSRISFLYNYKYTLEKYNNFWIITDIEATVVKGQKS